MKQGLWLFKKLNLNLRAEIIINISFLMIAAILLIGFTISKLVERNIIREKVQYGKRMAQDFQTMIDFLARDKKNFKLEQPLVQKEIRDFTHSYIKEMGFYELLIVDPQMKIIAKRKAEVTGSLSTDLLLRETVQTGVLRAEVLNAGNWIFAQYKKMVIYSPIKHQGMTVGGFRLEVPVGDVAANLIESQRMIVITVVLDAVVLIIYGSFVLSRVLVKPIKDLVQLTVKVSDGDFSQTMKVTSKNEIGQLIGSFNRMTDKLRENQVSLNNHVESLESINKQLKETQEELIRSEKLASIGKFAAGVAHEVGNPLGAILGYASLLQKNGMSHEESKDYLKRIEREIERINRIVRELLNFARPSPFEIKDIEVNKVIESNLSLLSYQKNFKNIEMRLDLQAGLPAVRGDESQLSQVVMNIILNSIDAMPQGGVLRVKTEEYIVKQTYHDFYQTINFPRRKSDPEESDYSRVRKLDYYSSLFSKFSKGDRLIKIRISDTGLGIRKEDIPKIFDPFFTTKAPDKGTGLGLSISFRIVESMGGEIRVESEVEKGTTFELYFPAAG